MQAIVVDHVGGPDALRLREMPMPDPGPGQARVKIAAAGINFIDIYLRTGQYKATLPAIPGAEAAGVVDAVGPGVTQVRPGDRVVGRDFTGAYAQYAVSPVEQLVTIPEGVSSQTAAAVMLQGMTAHYLVTSTYPLAAQDVALVHAAAGGVGRLLVQIAKKRGARVIGTAGTPEKAQLARQAGADEVILYREVDFAAETRRLTGGMGVQVVYDSVGKDTFAKSLDCLRRRGYLVLFGQSSGAVPPVDPQLLNAKGSLFLTRPTLAHYAADRSELLWRAGDIFRWISAGELDVRIDQTFALSAAGEAQQYLADRKSHGKLLLIPSQ